MLLHGYVISEMRKRLPLLMLWVLLNGIALHAGEGPDQTLPVKERVSVASHIFADVQIFFGHWEGIPNFDLNGEYSAYLDKVLASSSRKAFDSATLELMAKLQNGHSGFRDAWLQDTYGQQLNFYAYPVDGQWVVTRSELSDLKVGDVRIDPPFDAREQSLHARAVAMNGITASIHSSIGCWTGENFTLPLRPVCE